jgi:hypothetical protein
MTSYFTRLRERQEKRALEKARREGTEIGRKHTEVVARVEWAAAALALAEKTGDVEVIRKCTENAVAATTALNEMHRNEIAEIVRILDFIDDLPERN